MSARIIALCSLRIESTMTPTATPLVDETPATITPGPGRDGFPLAGRLAKFKRMTVGGRIKVGTMRDEARSWINKKYKGFEANTNQDNLFEAALYYHVYTIAHPYIVGAWANDEVGPPSATELLDVLDEELQDCLREIRRLNPTATELPDPDAKKE